MRTNFPCQFADKTYLKTADDDPMWQRLLDPVHPSWQRMVAEALSAVSTDYLNALLKADDWLPGPGRMLAAFSLPFVQTRRVMLGESPYPRAASANGYAFWDAAVGALWSETGLSKPVNRATSLRNLMKMLLVCDGALMPQDLSQKAIAELDKRHYISTLDELFQQLLGHGFLLMNTTPVFCDQRRVAWEAKQWRGFFAHILQCLSDRGTDCELILLGNVAKSVQSLPASQNFEQIVTEHPYNVSFIHNPTVHRVFKPLNLLKKP